MFVQNLKKDWKLNRSFLLLTFTILGVSIAFITLFYLILKHAGIEGRAADILQNIWLAITGIVTMGASILPIVLMFKIVKGDLGKDYAPYTVFTPQSITDWYLPKLLYVFMIQGVFALFNLFSAYLLGDLMNMGTFDTTQNVSSFFATTFSIGLFGLISLSMALYYSFRNKTFSWLSISSAIVFYFIATIIYSISYALHHLQGGEVAISSVSSMWIWIEYAVNSGLGFIYILLALYLFNKKVEY